jgi:hypothetical protein
MAAELFNHLSNGETKMFDLESKRHYNLALSRDDGPVMALEKELATYKSKLSELKEHEGKFVLIHGEDVVDFFAAYEDAIKAGYQRFKLEPFLVKQVNAVETVQHVTRRVLPYSQRKAS